jgi:hypothetical protein
MTSGTLCRSRTLSVNTDVVTYTQTDITHSKELSINTLHEPTLCIKLWTVNSTLFQCIVSIPWVFVIFWWGSIMCRSRDSVVGIATSYGLDAPRDRSSSPGRVKNFLFSKSSRPALRSTQLPIQWVPWDISSRVKRPGREVDHSPPTSAEVKKMWI